MISLALWLLAEVTPPPMGAVAPTAAAGAAKAAAGVTNTLAGHVPNVNATLSPDLLARFTHKSSLAANAPWLTHTFAGIFLVLAIGLIALLAMQTTKQEGLSGTIGGRVESAYRPRLGFDQQLARFTGYVAYAMVFFAVVLSITGI